MKSHIFKTLIGVGALACLATSSASAATPSAGIATSSSLLSMEAAQLERRLKDIKSLGAKWVRIDFNWATIQPASRNQYKWSAYDRVVRAARKHDLNILATLAYTPAWARNSRCTSLTSGEEADQKCSPRSTAEFARFARASALRYKKQGVHTWEIWNEPNLVHYWKTVGSNNITVDPEAYARTANLAAQEIKHNQPGAFVITGGLSPVFEPHESRGMRQSDYLAKLLPKLDARLFNAVGIHPYCWPKMPERVVNYNAFFTVDGGRQQHNLRAIMTSAGWGKKQIWATEFGASTKGIRSESQASANHRADHVSERKQAQIVGRGITSWHKKANVGPIFVHNDSDQWLLSRKNEGGFGLRRSDGSKKPAYKAYQKSVKNLK